MCNRPSESLVVVSDLDGTMLDHTTYSFDAARPAIEQLNNAQVPLVLCTSKTRAEVEAVRAALGNRHPFIVENGGGVYVPMGYFPFEIDGAEPRDSYLVIPIGDPYAELVLALGRASRASGVRVTGFANMSDDEVARATGMELQDARRARRREFDEPFVVLDPGPVDALLDAIDREGKQTTRGGRFYHIMGSSDKARAVAQVLELYRRQWRTIRTVGLGDAPNDAGFLRIVDVPILMPSPQLDQLQALVPQGRTTSLPGPAGWNAAVLSVLDELRHA